MSKHKKLQKEKLEPGKIDLERASRFIDDGLKYIKISPPPEANKDDEDSKKTNEDSPAGR